MRVKGVVTRDTGRVLDDLIHEAAQRHGFDEVGFLGGLIAESNLDEHSFREHRPWPDVSYGIAHQTVKWAHLSTVGLAENPAEPGTAADTPANRAACRAYFFDAARAIPYAAALYARHLIRAGGDPLDAWCLYNKPGVPPVQNPNRPNYRRGLIEAAKYAAPEEDPMPPTDDTAATVQPTLEDRMAQLEAQQALQTQALRRILEGKLEGAEGAAGSVVALEGGRTSITVTLGESSAP